MKTQNEDDKRRERIIMKDKRDQIGFFHKLRKLGTLDSSDLTLSLLGGVKIQYRDRKVSTPITEENGLPLSLGIFGGRDQSTDALARATSTLRGALPTHTYDIVFKEHRTTIYEWAMNAQGPYDTKRGIGELRQREYVENLVEYPLGR